MLTALRTSLFLFVQVSITIVYGSATIFLWAFPQRIRHRIIVTWCWFMVRWLRVSCGTRFQVFGEEHLKASTSPKVILSKHQSAWEPMILQWLCFPCSTILKKELLKIPFFGWGLRCLNPIAIDRSNPREALKQVKIQGMARLASNLNLLLFPEGTRTLPGERGKYARGGADIAIEAGVDIIPIAVNAGRCWPMNDWRRYPGLITVVVGAPIATAGRTSRDLIEEVENWIENEMVKMDSQSNQEAKI